MDAFSVRFAPDMTAGMEVAGRSGGEAIALLVTLVTPPKNLTLRFPAYNTDPLINWWLRQRRPVLLGNEGFDFGSLSLTHYESIY